MDLINEEAWARWVNYRQAIKKPLKPATQDAARLKLMRMGTPEEQGKIIDESISQGWQGLFPLDEKKPANSPHEPKKRTKEQEAAAQAAFEHAQKANEWGWKQNLKHDDIMAKLILAEALMARYDCEPDQDAPLLADKRESLRDQVANLLRIADPKKVLANVTTWRLVLRLYSQRGIFRLEDRAKEAA